MEKKSDFRRKIRFFSCLIFSGALLYSGEINIQNLNFYPFRIQMLLYGKPLADDIKIKLKSQILDFFGERKRYVAILFFGENSSSATYVKHKVKYGSEI